MRRVLVTGGTGFTGQRLCRRLRAEGCDVVTFVRPTSQTEPLVRMGVACKVVELTDRDQVVREVRGFSHVFHVAAAYRTEHADVGEFSRVNVDATGHLLDAARRSGVERFIHCSTVGVQGEIEDPPASEDDPIAPGDHYQESKARGERLALDHFGQGLAGTVVRPVGIYGPGDRRFLKLFRGIDRGRFVMIGSGDPLYHLTFVDDLVEGFLLAATRDEAVGEVFTIGGPTYTTVRELVDLLADVLGRPRPRFHIPFAPVYAASVVCERLGKSIGVSPPLYPRRLDFFSKDRAFSIQKARRLLGYEPRVPLEEGLRRTAGWYRDEGWL